MSTTAAPTPAPAPAPAPAGSPPAPKSWIQAIHAYVPGVSSGSDGTPLIKLSANENPLGASPKALEALKDGADHALAAYPDPDATALRHAIADRHGLEAERIVCGTGSDELLNLAAQGYAGPGDNIIHMRYGFAVYDIATRRIGATPLVIADADYGADVDAMLAAVNARTRLVFLANPNNPTGSLLSEAELERLHAGLPSDVLLVLDQAYGEYLEPDGDPFALARAHDNVLITRTFSKIYGLAGQRIGWAYGAPGLIDTLNRIRGPFNVTSSGQAAAIAALSDQDFVARSREHNNQWRSWLAEALTALGNHGVTVIPSHANFLLVRFTGAVTAKAALHALAEAGYAVRWLPGQGLPDALRITIGKEEDMRAVADCLAEAVTSAASGA